jgi:hypothetical protein
MTTNAIDVHRFDETSFLELVQQASGFEMKDVPRQVSYLASYCVQLGARTLVYEQHYVDRHYVDEYARYYARMLQPPKTTVGRIHVFGDEFTDEELGGWLEESLASGGARETIEQRLCCHYLGFISIRPLPSVPIGRSVLRRLQNTEQTHREIWATTTYHVHLTNLSLKVEGLAFQQQDVAVGECATASLWSALSRTARREGMRAPTPAEIAEAASRPLRGASRMLPTVSTGLTVQQLCDATLGFGFNPQVVSNHKPELLVMALHTYLLSGIPVVLVLRRENESEGHAVTAVGFQVAEHLNPALDATIPVRSAYLHKLYVHDDRLGPYARAPIELEEVQQGQRLRVCIEQEKWWVDTAIAPVYPKLRLSMHSLLMIAEVMIAVMDDMVGTDRTTALSVDFRYELAGDYLARLSGRAAPQRSIPFLRRVVLSRWCAVIRWYLEDRPLLELIYDTTDVLRNSKQGGRELLRGLVCLDQTFANEVDVLAASFAVPGA